MCATIGHNHANRESSGDTRRVQVLRESRQHPAAKHELQGYRLRTSVDGIRPGKSPPRPERGDGRAWGNASPHYDRPNADDRTRTERIRGRNKRQCVTSGRARTRTIVNRAFNRRYKRPCELSEGSSVPSDVTCSVGTPLGKSI